MFQNTAWARKSLLFKTLAAIGAESARFGLFRCAGFPVSCRKVYADPGDSHTGRVGKQHFLEFMLLYYRSASILRGRWLRQVIRQARIGQGKERSRMIDFSGRSVVVTGAA
ncbi:hypothetical protein, partial [Mesorhizobium sp.]|uniref:hypothetical protein n=1 Tax=Mesorhizobium sp. TaxID=1871066 RepID=UPI00257F2D61